jgi:acetoin utilization deacetylase AcuC-like enzyme
MKPTLWIDLDQGIHHGNAMHPESPDRILAIRKLLHRFHPSQIVLHERADPIPRLADPVGKHTWVLDDGDTYCTPYTAQLLERGKEMIEAATRDLAFGTTNCSFVFIRPPGHHANSKGVASGFCHQNNVWIAVEQLRKQGFHNIGIFDWDAHHGDGTEDCVRADGDPNVRFASMHAFGPDIFPGTGKFSTETILNVPLPVGTTSEAYVGHFHSQVLPFLAAGKPDILIISAGYDGHEKDPMALLQLRENTYTHMSDQLRGFDCPVLFLLEGGYNPTVLASCVEATLIPWISS